MKKSNRILIKTGFLLFLMSVVLLFPIKAKAATYQQVPTMAYLKVESGQAYLLMQIQHLSCFMNRRMEKLFVLHKRFAPARGQMERFFIMLRVTRGTYKGSFI